MSVNVCEYGTFPFTDLCYKTHESRLTVPYNQEPKIQSG